MQNKDYIIVGQGVAGSCFAFKLLKENKSFIVIDADKNKASSVAVGIYNPVVLKRFSLIWNASRQLDLMFKYFSGFEELLGDNYIREIPTRRIIKDENEIHAWNKKANQPELNQYLNPDIKSFSHPDFDVPFGYGEVKNTGQIDLGNCLSTFQDFLVKENLYLKEEFDYSLLQISTDKIQYKNITAKNIIFCEGFGITQNPYFNYLPVIGVKGEVLKIRTENEIPKAIWKAHNFLMPVDENNAVTASTYDRDDLTPQPTEKGKQEMLHHLRDFYKGKFEILEQTAGIRPTIIDRRPVIGAHPINGNMYILNGMGTRGTLLAPAMTEELFDNIENNQAIDPEANVLRFTKKYFENA